LQVIPSWGYTDVQPGDDLLGLATVVRAALTPDDDYATVGKPPCDWDDPAARETLVDALVRDANAAWAWERQQSCWRWSPVRTSHPVRTRCSASLGVSPGTG
jgi:hypothetical protein